MLDKTSIRICFISTTSKAKSVPQSGMDNNQ